jgi:Putative peptidoglycan binding domain
VTLATENGPAAADRMATWRTYAPGRCLEAVSKATGVYSQGTDNPGFYTYALRAFHATPMSHRHGGTPPKGAIVYLSASGNGYGHICLSLGGGRVVSTDVPSRGQVGVTTIAHLCAAWGRTYLGWADWLMGHPVTVASGATAPAARPRVAPPFPLPAGFYFGPKTGPRQSVSGFYGHTADLRRWQQRMHDRGWPVTPDGHYGPQTADVAARFQREKGLAVDGKIGPATWAAAWTAPVT